jgi:uncharacterized protein YfaS (alpha-2-macroglobulin family)
MAVAATDGDQYGFGEARVTTSKRLMARPALPRFLRAGDRLEAGVVVASSEFAPGSVTVNARAEGLTLEGPASKVVPLGRDQSVEVRFAFRAERAGEARLGFDVSGGGAKDRVEIRRPVSAPAVLEAVSLSGETEDRDAEALGQLAGIRPDVGGLEVSVASTALVGLESALTSLMEYPYGCTEQLTSRLLPLIPLKELAADFGVTPSNASKTIGQTIGQLVARQRGDGGFAMWPDAPSSYPWVSAYALLALHEARVRKEEVPSFVFERGRAYLRRLLERRDHLIDPPTEASILDVLAALGHPDLGYMNQLFERRKDLPVFGRALLLSAFVRAGARGEAETTLIRELEQSVRVSAGSARVTENLGDAYARVFDSPLRTQALVTSALARARPKHPLLADLVRGLLAARRGGTWRTTQETAHALLALDAFRKVHEAEEPDFTARVSLGSHALFGAEFEGRSLKGVSRSFPMAEVSARPGQALLFEREGSGKLYYQARLRYARKDLPKSGLDAGFYVEKRLRKIDENGASSAPPDAPGELGFKAGDLVRGEIVVVTSSAREFVVVDDPLPAGLEAVDTTLATSSRELSGVDMNCSDCQDGSISRFQRRELRDDRALFFVDYMGPGIHRYTYVARATSFGRFVVPPTRVEEMYTPETFGRTGASEVVVQ